MAQGYIQSQEKKRVEDVGSEYLNDLLGRSLIRTFNDKYVVHDLLHDLRRSIMEYDFCCKDVNELHKISSKDHQCHHLLLHYKPPNHVWEPERLYDLKKLRTFLVWFYNKVEFEVPHGFFINLKYLWVLDLGSCGLEYLSDSIGKLKHLRYLDLRGSAINHLPESLCELYMLQSLKLHGCDQHDMLPRGVSNLISLRHLEAKPVLISRTFGIGKLTYLQELEIFSLSEGFGIAIEDLKDLNQLRGKLCIQNLQRVGSKEEVSQAKLYKKQFLSMLEMKWIENANQTDSECDEEVLDGLLPPSNLKELVINCYSGAKSPSWMEYQYFSQLESICLRKCRRLYALPPIVRQLCCLRTLEIAHLPQLKELPPLPANLTKLVLQDVGLNVLMGLEELPLLQDLALSNIPDLKDLSPLMITLRTLTIESVGLEALPEFYDVDRGGSGGNRNSLSLSILKTSKCSSLKSLREGLLRDHHLKDLRVLSIKDCNELVHWPEGEGFQASLCTLEEKLSIKGCPMLMALPEGCGLPSSLKKLAVKGSPCFVSQSIFNMLQNLSAKDVYVEKGYQDWGCCLEEALQHMVDVDALNIEVTSTGSYKEEDECPPWPRVILVYESKVNRRLMIMITGVRRGSTSAVDGGGDSGADAADDDSTLITPILSTCLPGEGFNHRHPWTSSLRELKLWGIPERAFLGLRWNPAAAAAKEGEVVSLHELRLASLETLWICHSTDMMKLPTETLLSQLMVLKELKIVACPKLMWLSLEEGILSLPSLESLYIQLCPGLSEDVLGLYMAIDIVMARITSSSSPSPLEETIATCSSPPSSSSALLSSLQSPPPPPPPPPGRPVGSFIIEVASAPLSSSPALSALPPPPAPCLLLKGTAASLPSSHRPMLHYLFVDGTSLLHASFIGLLFHKYLTSLRSLGIWSSDLTSLTAEEEEGLRILSLSLQYLSLSHCLHLQHPPTDLRKILPSLKVLSIVDCSKIQFPPDMRLPSTLELLFIENFPAVVVEKWNWRRVASHVPVIVIDGAFLQGSYDLFLGLTDKWDFTI